MMIARRARTNDDRDDDTGDQRDRHCAFGSGFGSRRRRLLPLGRDGDGLGDRQKKSQRCTGEGVHVERE